MGLEEGTGDRGGRGVLQEGDHGMKMRWRRTRDRSNLEVGWCEIGR